MLSVSQAVQFSKLVSCLRPDEPEEVILSACQKLTTFLQQRPEQKIVFVRQHGLLPLMELLEVPSSHVCNQQDAQNAIFLFLVRILTYVHHSFKKLQVICSVIQVLNLIIKDNTNFLESACLIGLVSILNFQGIILWHKIGHFFYLPDITVNMVIIQAH